MSSNPVAAWTKSSRSYDCNACLEYKIFDGEIVGVRDSKNPGLILQIGLPAWREFIQAVRLGDLDGPGVAG